MKARVKATGEIVEIHSHSYVTELVKGGHPRSWMLTELETEETPDPDYWERLKHQYAGMAMQGILSNPNLAYKDISTETICNHVAERVKEIAHALVEKMKEGNK